MQYVRKKGLHNKKLWRKNSSYRWENVYISTEGDFKFIFKKVTETGIIRESCLVGKYRCQEQKLWYLKFRVRKKIKAKAEFSTNSYNNKRDIEKYNTVKKLEES